MATKICSKCKKEKNIDNFCNDRKGKDGKNTRCKECCNAYDKEYRESNKNKIREYKKEYRKANKNKRKIVDKKYMSSFIKYSHPQIMILSIYDEITEDKEGYALISCAYCGQLIRITITQAQNRLRACNTLNGGECRVYCSNRCQNACPIFNRLKYPLGFKSATSREVDPLLRQLCFKRDQYTCQHCGIDINSAQLHCHHIIGVAQSPIEQNDLSNVITLCKKCHKELHKTKGCTYQDYKCS